MKDEDRRVMSSLFDDITGDVEEVEDTAFRKNLPYKEAIARPASRSEAAASMTSLFDDEDDIIDRPKLDDIYLTQAEVLELKGTNGLKVLGTFDGGGGSITGFAWSGWQDVMSVEFVGAARDTLAANYTSSMIAPAEVHKVAVQVAKEMNLRIGTAQFKSGGEPILKPEGTQVVVIKEKPKGTNTIYEAINWELTLKAIGGDLANEFRYQVCSRVLEAHPRDEDILSVWGDDIRALDPQAILDHLGMERGELDCIEGSPPCKSFSTSGLRERGWGRVLHYSDERYQSSDDLFLEFLRLLDGLNPRSFVAENVPGLEMGSAEVEVMQPLIDAFSDQGYRVNARVLRASDYNVPQNRTRLIFQGIRSDQVDKETGKPAVPRWPKPSPHVYTVKDALEAAEPYNTKEHLDGADLTNYEVGKIWASMNLGGSPSNKSYQFVRCHPDLPSPTITATSAGNRGSAGPSHPHECRKFTIPEYRYLFSFPKDYVFTGSIDQQGERMGRSVPPYMMKVIADEVADILLNSVSSED